MEQNVSFQSDGIKIACTLFQPEHVPPSGCPGIVMCQGMAGVKEYFWFPHIGRRLAQLGFVALIWDYRGVGESEGEPGRLFPDEQADDMRNACWQSAQVGQIRTREGYYYEELRGSSLRVLL